MRLVREVWQSWRRSKGVALLAVLAFAVGIGSTTAIFAVINGVLLRPLPYAESSRFVALFGEDTADPNRRFTAHRFPDLIEFNQRLSSVDAFGWFAFSAFNLISPGVPQRVQGVTLTPSLARSLGVNPILGGWFADETGVMISTRLWRRLGGSPIIVGSPVTLDGKSFTIAGVMSPDFRFPIAGTVPLMTRIDIWTYLDPAGRGLNRNDSIYFSYGRRKPGVSLAQVEADAKRVAAEIAALDPARHPSYSAMVVDLQEAPFLQLRAELYVLFGAAGLLLLISCANVATLLLARSVSRVRETAIRVALGAARRHLALRYFVEGLLVSLAGAAAGMVLSVGLVRGIVLSGSELVPQAEDVGMDWKVFGAATLLAFVASALASAAPLWQAVRIAPNAVLADGVRASASARVRRLSHALVVGEIGLAFMLLAVSSVLVVHLNALTRVAPGFTPDDLVTFEVSVPRTVFRTKDRWPYQKRLLDAVAQIPGVSTAAFANQLPLQGCCLGGAVYPEGSTTDDTRRVSFLFITDDYFATMGIPLRAGRFLTERDTSDEVLFCVINQAAANRYWPNRNPVGAYAHLGQRDGNRLQVLGVVGDVRNELKSPPEAALYLLARFIPVSPMHFLVRSPLAPSRMIADIQRTVQRVDPTVVVHDAKTMNEVVRDSLQLERTSSVIMTFFALAALLMATLGIYGVVSYSVRQRTVELGTRMAVGAVPRDLLRLVVGGALKMAALGVTLGGLAVVGGVWLLVRYLEVRDISAVPFAFSTITVAAIAVAASYVPAWRATLLSPMVAIRDDPASAWQSARLRFKRAVESVKRATTAEDSPALSPTALLTEFVDAARAAASFADALRAAVATLCARLCVERALLLQRTASQEYHATVAIGPRESPAFLVPPQGFLLKRLEAYPHPLSFTRADFDVLVRWAEEHRPDLLDEIRWLRAGDVRTAVPLRTRREILGVLLLGPSGERERLSPAQQEVLPACADQFALMMENARLTDRVVEQEKVRRDLALAVEVQKRLLPEEVPSSSLAAFAGVSVPARSIGGDYYDFLQVGEHRIGIALADVSGKGIAAALIMAAVQASLRIISSDDDISLPRLAARLNEFLYRATPANKYATFFYAQVDATSRELRYVNAGHNPPYLVRTGGEPHESGDSGAGSGDRRAFEIQELSAGGAVVGMFPALSYEEASISLRSGDLLVAFTDGVTEAQNPESEEFGEERLKDLLCRLALLPVPEISAGISSALKEWIKDAAQYDDLTFVVMKVN